MNKSYNVTLTRTETVTYKVSASNHDEAEILACGSQARNKVIPSVSTEAADKGSWEVAEVVENKPTTRLARDADSPTGFVKTNPNGTVSPYVAADLDFPIPRGTTVTVDGQNRYR